MKKIMIVLMMLLCVATVGAYTIDNESNPAWVIVTHEDKTFKLQHFGDYCEFIWEEEHEPLRKEISYTEVTRDWVWNNITQNWFNFTETVLEESWVENPCLYSQYEDWLAKQINKTINYGVIKENPVFPIVGTIATERVIASELIETNTTIAHNYLYGSEGFYADQLSNAQIRSILNGMQVGSDGQIIKDSYHAKMVQELDGVKYEKSGVVRSFLVIVLQRLDIIISNQNDRISVLEDYICSRDSSAEFC